MAFDDIIDAVRDAIKGSTPDYLASITWHEGPLSQPLEDQEMSPRSMRAFQVIPGVVTGLGDYVGPGYEIAQELHVVLRYIHDVRGGTEWYDLVKMAADDAARIVERVSRPPVGDYASAGVFDIRVERHEQLTANAEIKGAYEQTITFGILHHLPAATETIRSLTLKRYGTYTALRAALAAINTVDTVARLVNSSTLQRIADYRWSGTKAVLVGTADLTKVGDGTTGTASYTTTAGGDIRPNSGGTVTLTYGTGVVVATAGADFYAAQESATADQLHVGTHTTYAVPLQSSQWIGEYFSANDLPAAGTAGRIARIVAEATGAQTSIQQDTGTAWEGFYSQGDVPEFADAATMQAATLYGEEVAYLTDESRLARTTADAIRLYDQGDVPTYADEATALATTLYGDKVYYQTDETRLHRVSGASAIGQYDEGLVPSYASTAAMEAARADGEYGTVSGDAAYTARVISGGSAVLLQSSGVVIEVDTLADGFALASPSDGDRFALMNGAAIVGIWRYSSDLSAWAPDGRVSLSTAGLAGATLFGAATVETRSVNIASGGAWSAGGWTVSGSSNVNFESYVYWSLFSAAIQFSAIRRLQLAMRATYVDTGHGLNVGYFGAGFGNIAAGSVVWGSVEIDDRAGQQDAAVVSNLVGASTQAATVAFSSPVQPSLLYTRGTLARSDTAHTNFGIARTDTLASLNHEDADTLQGIGVVIAGTVPSAPMAINVTFTDIWCSIS